MSIITLIFKIVFNLVNISINYLIFLKLIFTYFRVSLCLISPIHQIQFCIILFGIFIITLI